jgi:hypothetical protein
MRRDGLATTDFAGAFVGFSLQVQPFRGNCQRAGETFAHRGKMRPQAGLFRDNDCVNMNDNEIPSRKLNADLPQKEKAGHTFP